MKGPKQREREHVNLSRPLTLFDPTEDYETLQELHRVRTPEVFGRMKAFYCVHLLRELWFQYYGTYISSLGLRHAILIDTQFTSDSNPLYYSERETFHVHKATRYLQDKLDQPENIDDADLFTACCLALHHEVRSARAYKIHVNGILALLTCLRTRRDVKTPFSLFRTLGLDIHFWNIEDICNSDALHSTCQHLAMTFDNHGDPVRERIDYMLELAANSIHGQAHLKYYLCVQYQLAILSQTDELNRRKQGRQLCKYSLQSLIANSWSWIEVVDYLDSSGHVQVLYSATSNGFHDIEGWLNLIIPNTMTSRSSNMSKIYYAVWNSLLYYVLVMSTTVITSNSLIEAILSDRFKAALARFYRGLLKVAQSHVHFRILGSIFFGASLTLEQESGIVLSNLFWSIY